tara:strand:+ start:1269 stop:2003 length:735 start_codon:yes stop_codon:yes gene_type:complete
MEETIDNTPENNAKEILERLRINGLWEPAGLGLSYLREGERSLKLVQQENNPSAAQARIRMKILVEGIGWTVNESEVQLVDVQHLSPQERHMQELMKRQEIAQQWPCPDCSTPLSAFPLEEGVWTFDGQEEMTLPEGHETDDGKTTELVEQWSVVITCPVCNVTVPMEPYDFALLAGDDLMLRYDGAEVTYVALSRPEIINMVDNKLTESIKVLGTFCPLSGELLPPHVRGSVVVFSPRSEEEE